MCKQNTEATTDVSDGSSGPWILGATYPSPTLSSQSITAAGSFAESDYIRGNCSNGSSIALNLTCGGSFSIPENQAGFTQTPTGSEHAVTYPTNSCAFDKNEGWTPAFGTTCNRHLIFATGWQGLSPQCHL